MRIYKNLKIRVKGLKLVSGSLMARLINAVECARMGEPWTEFERARIINKYITKGFREFYSGREAD